MKTKIVSAVLIGAAIVVFSIAADRVVADAVDEVGVAFEQKPAEVRRESAKKLFKEIAQEEYLGSVSPEKVKLAAGILLNDSDSDVRRRGLSIVYCISLYDPIVQAVAAKRRPRIDFSNLDNVKIALFKLTNDPAGEIRADAFATLALAFLPTREMEKKILDSFAGEKEVRVRKMLIEAIRVSKYSSESINDLLIAALNDHPAVAQSAIFGIGELEVKRAIPMVLDKFPTRNVGVDLAIVNAFSRLSADMKMYLPQHCRPLILYRFFHNHLIFM